MRFKTFHLSILVFFTFFIFSQFSFGSEVCASLFSNESDIDISEASSVESVLQNYSEVDSSNHSRPLLRYDEAKFEDYKKILLSGKIKLSSEEVNYPSTELIMAIAETTTIRMRGGILLFPKF